MLNKPVLTVMKRILRKNEREDLWIVGAKTGKLLYLLLRVLEPEVVLEVGTSVGYSALWMASALEENAKGKLWTVESHEERFKYARENIKAAKMDQRVHQIKGHAPEIFAGDLSIPEVIDVAFFDATKQEHQSYFDAIYPRMFSGGMIVVDNVCSHRFGPMKEFIEKLHVHSGLKVLEIPVEDGLLLAKVV